MFKGEINKNNKNLFITSYFCEDKFGLRHSSTLYQIYHTRLILVLFFVYCSTQQVSKFLAP